MLGETHFATTPGRAPAPTWLTIPQRGLYTGVMILGAVGTGKTSACMYPYVEQLLRWRRRDPERKVGGLVLEVKGDFCKQVRGILARAGRADDYLEIGLGGDVCYNPLHNDLDPYAVAYAIASLLNNLFGKSKEPFWQQAYTDLLKFVILLRRITDGYTTLSEVYRYILDDGADRPEHPAAEGARSAEPPECSSCRSTTTTRTARSAPWTLWFCGRRRSDGAPVRGASSKRSSRRVRCRTSCSKRSGGGWAERRYRLDAIERWYLHGWSRLDAPSAVVHHRRRRRLPVAVRRQPGDLPHVLPAANGVCRSASSRVHPGRCRRSRICSRTGASSP